MEKVFAALGSPSGCVENWGSPFLPTCVILCKKVCFPISGQAFADLNLVWSEKIGTVIPVSETCNSPRGERKVSWVCEYLHEGVGIPLLFC